MVTFWKCHIYFHLYFDYWKNNVSILWFYLLVMIDVTAQGYNETNVPSENCKDALQLQAYWVQEVNFFLSFFFLLWAEEVVWDKCDESLRKAGVCV